MFGVVVIITHVMHFLCTIQCLNFKLKKKKTILKENRDALIEQ